MIPFWWWWRISTSWTARGVQGIYYKDIYLEDLSYSLITASFSETPKHWCSKHRRKLIVHSNTAIQFGMLTLLTISCLINQGSCLLVSFQFTSIQGRMVLIVNTMYFLRIFWRNFLARIWFFIIILRQKAIKLQSPTWKLGGK